MIFQRLFSTDHPKRALKHEGGSLAWIKNKAVWTYLMQSMQDAELKHIPAGQGGRASSCNRVPIGSDAMGSAIGNRVRQALVFGLLVTAMLFLPLMRGAGASAEEADGLSVAEILQLNALAHAEVMDFIHKD